MDACCGTAGARDIAAEMLHPVQIFAVCPFLAFDVSNARQRFLRFVTRQPGMLGSLAALLGSLPRAVQRWIVSTHMRGLEPHAMDAALGLLQWQPAVNALHLAKHEFIDLDSPPEWWLLKHFGEPMHFVHLPHPKSACSLGGASPERMSSAMPPTGTLDSCSALQVHG